MSEYVKQRDKRTKMFAPYHQIWLADGVLSFTQICRLGQWISRLKELNTVTK